MSSSEPEFNDAREYSSLEEVMPVVPYTNDFSLSAHTPVDIPATSIAPVRIAAINFFFIIVVSFLYMLISLLFLLDP